MRIDELDDLDGHKHIHAGVAGGAAAASLGSNAELNSGHNKGGLLDSHLVAAAGVSSSEKSVRDYFVSAVRRKYIPPLMECYQDILVISTYNYDRRASQETRERESSKFMKRVH